MMQRMMMQRMWMVLGLTSGLVLGAVLTAGVASAAEMYSWRTEDGVYAYTDDRDHIPARYAATAVRVKARSLGDYSRFTPQDDEATDHYAAKLAERLQYLRQVNATAALPVVAAAAPGYAVPRTLSFRTGGENSPEINVPIAGESQGPVIVEPINAKQTGDFRTRRVTVIRQGGKTIAVLKGNPHHHNPSTDIYDEDDLDQGLWDE